MDGSSVNQITTDFLRAFQNDYAQLHQSAEVLFYYLAGIQLVMTALFVAMKSNFAEFFARMIQLAFVLGVFYTLIDMAGTWMPALVNAFISVGSSTSAVQTLTPGSVLEQGLSIGSSIIHNFSNWGWLTNPFGVLLSIVLLVMIVILYALMAAELAIILVKTYGLISVSGLMFAFGANELVRPIAMNYFKAMIGLGLQLLMFYLLMGVGVQIGNSWNGTIHTAALNHDLMPFLIVAASVIVFYMILKTVPPFVASLSGLGGFRSFGAEAAALSATAGVQAAGITAGTLKASTHAGGQFSQGLTHAGVGYVGHVASTGGYGSVKAYGKAAGKTAGDLSASLFSAAKDSVMRTDSQSSFGQKFNSHMQDRRMRAWGSAPSGQFKSNSLSGGGQP